MSTPSVLTYADRDRLIREFAHVVMTARMVHIELPAYLGGEVELVVGAVTTAHLNRDQAGIAQAEDYGAPLVRLYSPKLRAILTVPAETITWLTTPDDEDDLDA